MKITFFFFKFVYKSFIRIKFIFSNFFFLLLFLRIFFSQIVKRWAKQKEKVLRHWSGVFSCTKMLVFNGLTTSPLEFFNLSIALIRPVICPVNTRIITNDTAKFDGVVCIEFDRNKVHCVKSCIDKITNRLVALRKIIQPGKFKAPPSDSYFNEFIWKAAVPLLF